MNSPRVLNAPWLTCGPASRVLQLLNGNGEEARVVGGAVRNALLGVAIGDVDIATTATPDEVIRRAHGAGFKVALTGVAHGTVTVIVEGRPIEATTLRQDVETDGRRAGKFREQDETDDHQQQRADQEFRDDVHRPG